jgi:hypothetical protein
MSTETEVNALREAWYDACDLAAYGDGSVANDKAQEVAGVAYDTAKEAFGRVHFTIATGFVDPTAFRKLTTESDTP